MAQVSYIGSDRLVEMLTKVSARGTVQIRIKAPNQLLIGTDPLRPTSIIDFAEEAIVPIQEATETDTTEVAAAKTQFSAHKYTRKTGKYSISIMGQGIDCNSLKESLSEGLQAIERHTPGTLEKLSQIKPRTKRIVAHDANQLFDQPELVEKYSEKLINGWWYGTNNSANETIVWLKRACELAGLKWKNEFNIKVSAE